MVNQILPILTASFAVWCGWVLVRTASEIVPEILGLRRDPAPVTVRPLVRRDRRRPMPPSAW